MNEDPEHCLFEAIAAIKDTGEAKQFFLDLCTPMELEAMADRWRVVEPIKRGLPYRQIHDETGVSVTTIGRVARHVSLGTGGYNIIYERLKRKEDANEYTLKNRNTKKRTPKKRLRKSTE